MGDDGQPTDAPGQGRPAGPGAEGMTAEGTIGDRPPPEPDAAAAGLGVLEEDASESLEPSEAA